MRVATVDGLVTLFYDGSRPLWNEELHEEFWLLNHRDHHPRNEDEWEKLTISDECKNYWKERLSWQQIIIEEGVREIPGFAFCHCQNIQRVIFADTVIRIESLAFSCCSSLTYIKWSINLEEIGHCAFSSCDLSSVFIPPRCREIREFAFACNRKLEILNVPPNVELLEPSGIISNTAINRKFSYRHREPRDLDLAINEWLKNINNGDEFALHRVCCSFEPTLEMILDTMKEKGGPKAFKVENSIGITPSRYLKENPYANVSEKEVIEKYILQMMGELQSDQEVL
ncbi:hypothetical protein CTEN210_13710 [Chaetoceros tenuissimus]|uniref:Leucine-rich repeat domain-containing protein n=1 Tax=Chaetoceros tenuissimus TaxID=426638 RepID=A0AAD3D3U5_9STRA|nr:hypothetical protein CTEN210_13710 [Chaetoceros tenuissimus]